jgi:hypothetical protein
VDVLNTLTGNLDREGGAMFSNPIAWSLASLTPPEFANGFTLHRWRSRVRGAPEVLGQVPVSCLAEEIATPGRGHDKPEARLSVASRHAGVCNNVLAPGELVDVPSGNAVVNGIPVEVAPLG